MVSRAANSIIAANKWQKDALTNLRESIPGYDFWVINPAVGPAVWCWRPVGSTDGRESQHRGSPELVAAEILGDAEAARLLEALRETPPG